MKYTETEKEERMKLIRWMYENGDSTSTIGREIGVSHQTVRNWLIADGVKLKRPRNGNRIICDVGKLKELAARGLTQQEISDQMHVSRHTVGVWMSENGIKVNTESRKKRQEKKKEEKDHLSEKPKKKCKTCIYRSMNPNYGCNYEGVTLHCRLPICPVIGCTVYKRGKPLKSKKRIEDD